MKTLSFMFRMRIIIRRQLTRKNPYVYNEKKAAFRQEVTIQYHLVKGDILKVFFSCFKGVIVESKAEFENDH